MMPNPIDLAGERPSLAPDAEAAAFARTRDLVHGRRWLRWLRLLAVVFTALAFGRIVSDTSWDVSPRRFIATAAVAFVCWTGYFAMLVYYRRRSLRL